MMPSMLSVPASAQGSDSAKKAMAAMLAALSSDCDCEACRLLRDMAKDMKADLIRS
jgi:hypothetical protein